MPVRLVLAFLLAYFCFLDTLASFPAWQHLVGAVAAILVAPGARRLLDALVLNRATTPRDLANDNRAAYKWKLEGEDLTIGTMACKLRAAGEDQWALDGEWLGNPYHANLRTWRAARFELQERGFHWINEDPYVRRSLTALDSTHLIMLVAMKGACEQ